MPPFARRRDGNERAIVAALRAAGASVFFISDKDVPDLCVGVAGVTYLLEVKREAGARGGVAGNHAVLKPGQAAFAAGWRGAPVHVVRTVAEALAAVGLPSTVVIVAIAGQHNATQAPRNRRDKASRVTGKKSAERQPGVLTGETLHPNLPRRRRGV